VICELLIATGVESRLVCSGLRCKQLNGAPTASPIRSSPTPVVVLVLTIDRSAHLLSQIRLKSDVENGTDGGLERSTGAGGGEEGGEDMVLPLRMLGASRIDAALQKAVKNNGECKA
jgi:hypothetical protein